MIHDREDRADDLLGHVRDSREKGFKGLVGLLDDRTVVSRQEARQGPLGYLRLILGDFQRLDVSLQEGLDKLRILPRQGAAGGDTVMDIGELEIADVNKFLVAQAPGHESRRGGNDPCRY